mmetsp:Transcript_36932/g.115660  ORF Transcript_36932/g.115660 Transcript_36932/m.115660 type:complete len:314 (+) Transcript_36932:132-1073(+)
MLRRARVACELHNAQAARVAGARVDRQVVEADRLEGVAGEVLGAEGPGEEQQLEHAGVHARAQRRRLRGLEDPQPRPAQAPVRPPVPPSRRPHVEVSAVGLRAVLHLKDQARVLGPGARIGQDLLELIPERLAEGDHRLLRPGAATIRALVAVVPRRRLHASQVCERLRLRVAGVDAVDHAGAAHPLARELLRNAAKVVDAQVERALRSARRRRHDVADPGRELVHGVVARDGLLHLHRHELALLLPHPLLVLLLRLLLRLFLVVLLLQLVEQLLLPQLLDAELDLRQLSHLGLLERPYQARGVRAGLRPVHR